MIVLVQLPAIPGVVNDDLDPIHYLYPGMAGSIFALEMRMQIILYRFCPRLLFGVNLAYYPNSIRGFESVRSCSVATMAVANQAAHWLFPTIISGAGIECCT